jgi:hypothetical protein
MVRAISGVGEKEVHLVKTQKMLTDFPKIWVLVNGPAAMENPEVPTPGAPLRKEAP